MQTCPMHFLYRVEEAPKLFLSRESPVEHFRPQKRRARCQTRQLSILERGPGPVHRLAQLIVILGRKSFAVLLQAAQHGPGWVFGKAKLG